MVPSSSHLFIKRLLVQSWKCLLLSDRFYIKVSTCKLWETNAQFLLLINKFTFQGDKFAIVYRPCTFYQIDRCVDWTTGLYICLATEEPWTYFDARCKLCGLISATKQTGRSETGRQKHVIYSPMWVPRTAHCLVIFHC